jgi:hypothetical protein
MVDMPNGGPAFPLVHYQVLSRGLSLRDYFAAHAPTSEGLMLTAGSAANERPGVRVCDEWARLVAEHAYRYADAMLKERSK